MSPKTTAFALAALIAAGAFGYWSYGTHQQRGFQRSVIAQVNEVTVRLGEALKIETAGEAPDRAQTAKKLNDHAAAVDASLQGLKLLDASRDRALVDAADDYLVTAREILKKQADAHRHRMLWEDSYQALRDHMRRDAPTGVWVTEAVKARERVNRDYRGYSTAAKVFGSLLYSLPGSQARIAPYLPETALIGNEVVAAARKSAEERAREAAAEMEKIKTLQRLR